MLTLSPEPSMRNFENLSDPEALGSALAQDPDWWRGAVIYQVYPRSFADSNGDGIGDLRGIRDRLSHIADLGADAVWVSPFYASPMKDFGYDVSDYRAVDPMFGTLEDFDALVEEARRLGLRVMIDLVISHTSDKHAWFAESRVSRENPRSDWYVWADPREDGTPPNNWLSIFGGSAWQWDSRREQYYLHNFLASQPDLNFHNPEVREQMLAEMEFWLQRGVHGLRLDAVNFCFHDDQLRDNPPKPEAERTGRGFATDNPYAYQRHIYDNTRPENLDFLQQLRKVLDRYPGAAALGEVSAEDSPKTMADYTQEQRLHMAYSFDLLGRDRRPEFVRETVSSLNQTVASGWACWCIGNHDVERVMSRWGRDEANSQMAKLFAAMLVSLRGSICIYQGEELGLTEADIAEHELRDPYGIAFWPRFKGRDGCRTPIPWSKDAPHAGFSASEPWLPIPEEHVAHAVDAQRAQPDSVLNFYRKLIHWRRGHRALIAGDIEFPDAPENLLVLRRSFQGESLTCIFNFGRSESIVPMHSGRLLSIPGGVTERKGDTLVLPGYGWAVLSSAL